MSSRDIDEMCTRIMQLLIKETKKNETVSVSIDYIWEKACNLYSPVQEYGPGLKNVAFQELLHLGDIQPSQTDREIHITYHGKNNPKYQPPDNL